MKAKLRIVSEAERPLRLLTVAERYAAVQRDFRAEPWIRGEGATYYTPERVSAMKAENEARRKRKRL